MPLVLAERVCAEFGDRMAAASPLAQQPDSVPALAKRLRLAAVRAERDELIRMWRNAEVSDDVLHHLEEELDRKSTRLNSSHLGISYAVFCLKKKKKKKNKKIKTQNKKRDTLKKK